MENLKDKVSEINEKIIESCRHSGRDPSEVRIVAVTKSHPVELLKNAYNQGLHVFGENRVQELLKKQPALPSDIEWHLIGTLQRNKIKYIIGKVALVHSVHSLQIAQEISKEAVKRNQIVDVLLQVNISGEESKSGFSQEELLSSIEEFPTLKGIKVKGLMTIAPIAYDPEDIRFVFRRLRLLGSRIRAMKLPYMEMQELSMGMSEDYPVAVEEGATIIRVGSGIFGSRIY